VIKKFSSRSLRKAETVPASPYRSFAAASPSAAIKLGIPAGS
jgi:hypothetical protein